MPPKTPRFWADPTSRVAALLSPLSALYAAGRRFHQSTRRTYRSTLPVVCIGNIVAGGSGKTPTVIALVHLIRESSLFQTPCVLTRGYGGALTGPTLVDLDHHAAADVGDEALLLAHHAPVIVSHDRVAGAKLAELSGADIIIMDDGFQNPSLHKTLSILVIDAAYGLGNGRQIPAGPLRESLAAALRRADAVLAITPPNGTATDGPWNNTQKPVLRAQLMPAATIDPTIPLMAFAGLGRPEKFFETLSAFGAKVISTHAFADHHPYTDADLAPLAAQAEEKKATLITTEKDYVRLPPAYRDKVAVLPVELRFQSPDDVLNLLRQKVSG